MAEISPFVDDPDKREDQGRQLRAEAANASSELGLFPRATNGDEERYPNRIGNFSKTLPHNDLGEVEPDDYQALMTALHTGEFDDFEALRLGGRGKLANPLGGLAFNIEGYDSPFDGLVEPPPAFASAEAAALMAEMYWMAVCRDVPFSQYDSDPTIAAAVDDLGSFPGYRGPTPVTPRSLFRMDYPGALDGGLVSQFLLQPFRYDGILVPARTRVPAPVAGGNGIDFLTTYDEWLCAQRGFPAQGNPFGYQVCPLGEQVFVDDQRFIGTARDLGQNAAQDTINSAYFRAMLLLGGMSAPADAGNPYRASRAQSGFSTFGGGHLAMLVGSVHRGERHTWYQKWNLHRFLRPEAFGGRVHNVRTGRASYPVHQRLLGSPVLDRVFAYNQQVNQRRGLGGGQGSFLLPILSPGGSPSHSSFPSGHAFTAGACVTLLKAWFQEDFQIPDPVKLSNDGVRLEPYVVGRDGPPLTVGGELNKLCHNITMGRDMLGVHYRHDDAQGNRQGEQVAIRILQEARPTYPEPFNGFTLTKFYGTTITV
jgi:hypothetical protein